MSSRGTRGGRGGGGGPAIRGLRGGAAGRGGAQPSARPGGAAQPIDHVVSDHVKTVGVKRTAFGREGRAVQIKVNFFETSIPTSTIHHYDVIMPSEKVLPARLNMIIIRFLQELNPDLFTPKAVYDGRKNLYAPRELPFGAASKEFDVPIGEKPTDPQARGPKVYKVRLTKVAEINPVVLQQFVEGKQSWDTDGLLTAITALNVVIRMEPNLKHTFNVRSFFTRQEHQPLGGGLELWRGYFQSLRPGMQRCLINIDISTGVMYEASTLSKTARDFLSLNYQQRNGPPILPKTGISDGHRLSLQRFITGIRIRVKQTGPERVVKKLSTVGARSLTFKLREGGSMTVADYFKKTYNTPLQEPDSLCVEVGSGALIPLELCYVVPGQIMRKQVNPKLTSDVLSFATKRPTDRLRSIKQGLDVLAYGQSEYVRSFGMDVKSAGGPLSIKARILPAPTLRYGAGSRVPTIVPKDGAWNMVDKRFFQPVDVKSWMILSFERRERFNDRNAEELSKSLQEACQLVGMKIPPCGHFATANGQGNIQQAFINAATNLKGGPPHLVVVVLPEGGNDLYISVKHVGDVKIGVATQCLKSLKCRGAKPQYWANVCLKINVKLGGINLIPDPASVKVLTEPSMPTMVMGADVVHPGPGSLDKPSYTALVGSVDSATSKYMAVTEVQNCRVEMIEGLKGMAYKLLMNYLRYRRDVEKLSPNACPPKRIIFYRDGVSEGQFKAVLEQELQALKAACLEMFKDPAKVPKITVIVVGKRHHVRFFPSEADADRSGNCPAGTVVDSDVTHPTEFDFYLQSHGGLLGTSRPAHYSVLYDENNFSPDALQRLSFALTHVYARSTRSVSIPAPVYYADIVCARSRNHYDPNSDLNFSESATHVSGQAGQSLEEFRSGFLPTKPNQAERMYFM